MNDEERILRAVHCESPGVEVVELRRLDPFILVELADDRTKLVQPLKGFEANELAHRRAGFELLLVYDRPPSPLPMSCVALFDDGKAYLLNDKDQLARFYHQAASAIPPFELACLLVMFQSSSPDQLVTSLDALDALDLETPVTSLPGFTPLRVVGAVLEFWSYHVGLEGRDSLGQVDFTRWRVTGLDGDLQWDATYVGSIRSNKYDPRKPA